MNGKKGLRKNSMILLPITLLFMGVVVFFNFYLLYQNAKGNLVTMKENELLQAAHGFGDFYVESTYTVKHVAYSLEGMLTKQVPTDEMFDYLETESKIYMKLVDNDSTGLYGWIGGEYLDGTGWVPDQDYVPQERPWYQKALEAKGKVGLVSPYVDSQTGTVMISICKLLSDYKSVVSLDVSLDDTQALVEQAAIRYDWDFVMVMDGDGMVVAHSENPQGGLESLRSYSGLEYYIASKRDLLEKGSMEVRFDGKKYEVFCAPVWDDWKAVAVVESGKCFASLYKLYILFFVSLVMAFGFLSCVYLHLKQNQIREMALNQQIKAIAGIFVSVYLIDLKQDTFSEIAVNSDSAKMMSRETVNNAQNHLRSVMDTMTDQRYKKGIYGFISFATLKDRLSGKKAISKEFIDISNSMCRGVFVPVEWDADGDLHTVLWMVEIIDERSE